MSVDTPKQNRLLRLTWRGLNHLFWPAVCINCSTGISESDNGLCKDCWTQLLNCTGPDYCPRCGRDVSKFALLNDACPDCQGSPLYFDRIARSGFYAESLQTMILRFKLYGKTELLYILAFLANSALHAADFCNDIDYFVPVPIHWTRRLARGCNHSLLLAKKLKHNAAAISTDLVRIRRTKSQPAMATPARRAANVAGAFAVRKGHPFNKRVICLVDDIKTTGATLNECAKTLKQAGASKVFALVLAVAGQRID